MQRDNNHDATAAQATSAHTRKRQRTRARELSRHEVEWLRQVSDDLGAPALRVAFVLLVTFVNRKTEEAWPSQKTLAAECDGTERAVRATLRKLVDHGHLELVVSSSGAGRGNVGRGNTYRLRHKTRKTFAAFPPEKKEGSARVFEGKPGSSASENPEVFCKKPGRKLPPNKKEENKTGENKNSICTSPDDLFGEQTRKPKPSPSWRQKTKQHFSKAEIAARGEEWWSDYPATRHKTGKAGVLRQYEQIIRRGDATLDELHLAVKRYAAIRAADNKPDYTLSPKRWLKDEHWKDEPLAPLSDGRIIDQFGNLIPKPRIEEAPRRPQSPSRRPSGFVVMAQQVAKRCDQ